MNLKLCEKYLSTAKRKTHNLTPDNNYIDLETYYSFVESLWYLIKINPNIMEEAIQVTKDKFGTSDILKGINVCVQILLHRSDVPEIADRLIRIILSNKDISRISISIPRNFIARVSFLELAISDKNLKLSKNEKKLILEELKKRARVNELSYLILKNNHFTAEEKMEIIESYGDEGWDNYLDEIRIEIESEYNRNIFSDYPKDIFDIMDTNTDIISEMYFYRYQEKGLELANRLSEEIEFFKQLITYRDYSYNKPITNVKKLTQETNEMEENHE